MEIEKIFLNKKAKLELLELQVKSVFLKIAAQTFEAGDFLNFLGF